MTLGTHGSLFRMIGIRKHALMLLAVLGFGLAWSAPASAANSPPSVTTNPSNTTVNPGATASFSAAASGTPTPSVQWQIKPTGSAVFTNMRGETSTSLSFVAVASASGSQVRAVFTNSQGTATTNAATLIVNSPPSVTTNPSTQSIAAGSSVTFNAAATGGPIPTVQWQVSTDGGATFNDIGGATSAPLVFTTAASDNGHLYRAVFTNTNGTATTTAATLNVLQSPIITTNPVNSSVNAGQTATFAAAASGVLTPTVQWQSSTDGGATFTNIPGALLTTLTVPNAAAIQNGTQYRAVFTNASGSATSTAATLSVNSAPVITTNPTSQSLSASSSVTFNAAASGNPAPTVQWQESSDGGATFHNIGGATSASLTFTVAPGQNGNQYRAVFTNSNGSATTTAATLTVTAGPIISTNPANSTVNEGQTASFMAAASGAPTPTVQWQSSTDGGATFNNIAGATTSTLNVTGVTSAQNGTKYRAVFSNTGGSATTAAATLTVQTGPVIATNPSNQSVNAGSTATFTASASGSPTPTVQWQVSTDGGGVFNNIAGATSTTLSFTTTGAQNGNRYRAVFTNAVSSATTSSATLTVILSTTTTLSSSSLTSIMNAPVTLTATVTPTPIPGSGSVTFKEGATTLCPPVTLVSGTASCSASFATAGTHVVTAIYSGGNNFAGSTSAPLTITVSDQRFKTVQAIGNFLSLRNDMLLSTGPDGGRQIDRLLALQDGEGGGSGFAANATSTDRPRMTASHASALGGISALGDMFVGGATRPESPLDDLIARNSLGNDAAQQTQSGFFPAMGSLRGSMSDNGAINASFSTSLSEVMRYVNASDLGVNEARGTRVAGYRPSRFDVWVEGHFSNFDDDRGGIDSSGYFGVGYIGADYAVKPWLLVGILGQYDDMRQTSGTASFRTEGTGWMAGPYATARLAPHLFLQGRVAWGISANKVSPFMTYVDQFDSTRLLGSATLTGAWSEGAWQFTPSASLAFVRDDAESYIDHFSVLIPAVESSLGQFRAEPEVSYTMAFSDGTMLQPRLKASAIWNFENSGDAGAFGGTLTGPQELRGKVEGGIGLRFNNGISLDVSGSYDGIGSSDYNAESIAVSARMPF